MRSPFLNNLLFTASPQSSLGFMYPGSGGTYIVPPLPRCVVTSGEENFPKTHAAGVVRMPIGTPPAGPTAFCSAAAAAHICLIPDYTAEKYCNPRITAFRSLFRGSRFSMTLWTPEKRTVSLPGRREVQVAAGTGVAIRYVGVSGRWVLAAGRGCHSGDAVPRHVPGADQPGWSGRQTPDQATRTRYPRSS